MKINNNLRLIALLVWIALLGGCATKDDILNPAIIYTSEQDASTQIILYQTRHLKSVFTPEGLRNSATSSDYKYSLKSNDDTIIDLPFLDAQNASIEARINHIFYNMKNAAWVATTITQTSHLEHVRGLFEWKDVDDLFVNAYVKTFTKNILISDKKIEVCNPFAVKNSAVEYDKSLPALRYCGKNGTTVYFPFTKTFEIENSSNCCPYPPEQRHFGVRRTELMKEATISTTN